MDQVFAPIEVTLPSLQHKHPVIIYDSKLFPGRSSEWFFHKSNRVSGYHVYRCVRCKSVNEKSKRSGQGSLGVPARIYIQDDHFMTDPDQPIGGHICSFETNPECETSSVYAKRAILEANLDMRENPERPKAKYRKMLTFFEHEAGRYGHLDSDTKRRAQTILNQFGNGFNARKRGLMLNYQLGRKKRKTDTEPEDIKFDILQSTPTSSEMQAEPEDTTPESVEDVKLSNAKMSEDDGGDAMIEVTEDGETPTPVDEATAAGERESSLLSKELFPCGGADCPRLFKSAASRTRHRTKMHPELYFIDTEDDLYVFRMTWDGQEVENMLAEEMPKLPFAVYCQQQPVDDEFGDTFQASEVGTAAFQARVSDLLNALHNMSFYMPHPSIQAQFCSELEAIFQKYSPLQSQNPSVAIDEEVVVTE